MALVVPTNSWVTQAEADTYLGDRLAIGDYWNATAEKDAALVTAWRWLTGAGDFTFPAVATQAMKDAQVEYAVFLIQHQPDIDLRMGLQAQGVTAAGVVKEKYSGMSTAVPYPPIVSTMLRSYLTYANMELIDLARNENESVTYNAEGDKP